MNAYIKDIYTYQTKGVYQIDNPNSLEVRLSCTDDTTNNVTLYYHLGFELDTIVPLDLIFIPDINVIGVIDSAEIDEKTNKSISVNYRFGFQFNMTSQYLNTRGILETNFISNLLSDWTSQMSWMSQILTNSLIILNQAGVGGYLFFDNDGAVMQHAQAYRSLLRQGFKIEYQLLERLVMSITKPDRQFWNIRIDDVLSYQFRLDTSQPNALKLKNKSGSVDMTVSLKQDGTITQNMVYDGNNQSVKPYILQTEVVDSPTLNEAIAKLQEITYQNSVEIEVRKDWVYLREAFDMYGTNIHNLCGDGVIIKLADGRELISIVDEVTVKHNSYIIKLGQSKNRIF